MNPSYGHSLHAILPKLVIAISLGVLTFLVGCWHRGGTNPAIAIPVITYHYDNLRSGWNPKESQLTYSNVNSSSLKVVSITLDDPNDQVDTQPLIVPNLQVAGAKHDVVYVTTEANNIYTFDGNSGARLLPTKNLGPPVPMPQGCTTNGPTVGIDGTPAIDLQSSTMYVITYNLENAKPVYRIHAIDLATLSDKVQPPPLITAQGTLSNGKSFSFVSSWERQRTAMLLANGNVYVGFGGVCDSGGEQSRGWVMGWKTPSLDALPVTELTNSQASEPNGMFLSGVWMSGSGIAGDQSGNIYFSTGNSDPSGTAHDELTNISQTVVKLKSDLTRPSTTTSSFLFTPDNFVTLEVQDLDVSAGGVMLLPPQPGPVPNMVAAASKEGRMFLLNSDNLGHHDAGALDVVNIGNCWCAPIYFNDGSPHIISSGGTNVSSPPAPVAYAQNSLELWDLQTLPKPTLTQRASSNMPDTIQDAGFFTTVSSNGPNNAIIWAVSRPQKNANTPSISLYAFKATASGSTLPPLFQSVAGSWPYLQANANIVPVVANGKVYVASYKELDIFGLKLQNAQGAQKVKAREKALAQAQKPKAGTVRPEAAIAEVQGAQFVKGPEQHQLSGVVLRIDGNRLTIKTRNNKTVEIDATKAKSSSHYYATMPVGTSVVAAGSSFDSDGVLQAELVWRVKASPATWPPDR